MFPESDLVDLRDRLARSRWPSEVSGAGWDRGVPVDYLQGLATYWRHDYDWRKHEAELNRHPQFTTTIEARMSTSCTCAPRSPRRCH